MFLKEHKKVMDKEIVKQMREAIKKGDLNLVKELVTSNEALLDIDTVFGSWLHVASAHGKPDIVKYLIDCGMDVNKNGAKFDVSEATKNPLFGAIYYGHFNVV